MLLSVLKKCCHFNWHYFGMSSIVFIFTFQLSTKPQVHDWVLAVLYLKYKIKILSKILYPEPGSAEQGSRIQFFHRYNFCILGSIYLYIGFYFVFCIFQNTPL